MYLQNFDYNSIRTSKFCRLVDPVLDALFISSTNILSRLTFSTLLKSWTSKFYDSSLGILPSFAIFSINTEMILYSIFLIVPIDQSLEKNKA